MSQSGKQTLLTSYRSQVPRDTPSQKQILTKAQASTSSLTREGETPRTHEQRLETDSAYLKNFGTSTYVQTPAAKSLQPQGLPNNGLTTTGSNTVDRELLGIGAQFDGIDITHDRRGVVQSDPVLMCPYHGRAPRMDSQNNNGRGLDPMNRYLAEGASDRYSMRQQRYHGGPDARYNCTCTMTMQSDSRTWK